MDIPKLHQSVNRTPVTFDIDIAQFREKEGQTPARMIKVPVRRLENILEELLPTETHIDFMSVDTEGFDFDVLESNDWNRFRPSILLVEIFECSLEATARHKTSVFLAANGYELIAKTLNTAFYRARG